MQTRLSRSYRVTSSGKQAAQASAHVFLDENVFDPSLTEQKNVEGLSTIEKNEEERLSKDISMLLAMSNHASYYIRRIWRQSKENKDIYVVQFLNLDKETLEPKYEERTVDLTDKTHDNPRVTLTPAETTVWSNTMNTKVETADMARVMSEMSSLFEIDQKAEAADHAKQKKAKDIASGKDFFEVTSDNVKK